LPSTRAMPRPSWSSEATFVTTVGAALAAALRAESGARVPGTTPVEADMGGILTVGRFRVPAVPTSVE
jgi:hypothetical protein